MPKPTHMIDSPESSKHICRKANKILNNWIKQHMPYTANVLFSKKEAEHQENITELARLKKEEKKINRAKEKIKNVEELSKIFNKTAIAEPTPMSSENQALLNTIDKSFSGVISNSIEIAPSPDNENHLNQNELTATVIALLENVDTLYEHSPALAHEMIKTYVDKQLKILKIQLLQKDLINKRDEYAIISPAEQFFHPSEMFKLYLFPDDINDDDIILDPINIKQDQTEILKIIKELVKTTKEQDLASLLPVSLLLQKTATLLWFNLFENQTSINYHTFEQWAKIGLWLVERKKNLNLKKNSLHYKSMKAFCDHVNIVSIFTSGIYYLLAANLTITVSPLDMDLLLAESFLDIASQLQAEKKPISAITTPFKQIEYSVKAKLAYENQDYEIFLEHVNKAIKLPSAMTLPFFRVLRLAGNYCATNNPQQSLHYYRKALEITTTKNILREILHLLQADIDSIIYECKKIERDMLYTLRHPIRAAYPECKIISSKDDNLFLAIFFPLPKLPKNLDKIFSSCNFNHITDLEIFDNTLSKGKSYTGFRLKTASLAAKPILDELKIFFSKVNNAFTRSKNSSRSATSYSNSLQQATSLPQANSYSPFSTQPSSGKTEAVSNSNGNGKDKVKTRKQPTLSATSSAPTSASAAASCVSNMLYAHDVGFITTDNPAVTPVYCSRQAQQKQSTKLYVAWQGIPHIDSQTEKLFEDMLNPTPEGLVTARMVNQAGPKLWKDPDSLGHNWNLTALRFKRKGHGAGWLRAITIPDQKVEVKTENGNTVSRYLFRLGLPKHK